MKKPWIRVIEPEQATDRLREVYDETLKKRGKLAEIHKIHSLNPESLASHMQLYMTLLFGQSPLRAAGLSDQEILDAAQIAAYFNFVNRLVLGLGVAVEDAKQREGYRY